MNNIIQTLFLLFLTLNLYSQKIILKINLDSTKANNIAISPDGKYLAAACQDKIIRIFNTSDGSLYQTLEGHKTEILCIDYSYDNKYIASGGWDNIIKIWDASTGKFLKNIEDNKARINSIKFSPNNNFLAAAYEDGKIIIWNTTSWKLYKIITKHTNTVNTIAFSPNGLYLASASWDKTIGLFNVNSGELISSLTGHLSGVNTVAFSPDGSLIASGSDDRTIKLWNVKDLKLIQTFNRRNDGIVNTVIFYPENNFIISGNENNSIDIWDIKKMKHKSSLSEHKARINSIVFNKSDIMATAADDNSIILWDVSDLKYEQCYEEKLKAYSYLSKPKDEFETTEQYLNRLEQFNKVKEGLKTECEIEFKSKIQEKIQSSYSWVNLTIQALSEYNADEQQYYITVNNQKYILKMPINEAKTFKENWKKAKVKGIKKYNPETKTEVIINMQVIHPLSQNSYYFGEQISPEQDPALNNFLKKYPK